MCNSALINSIEERAFAQVKERIEELEKESAELKELKAEIRELYQWLREGDDSWWCTSKMDGMPLIGKITEDL